MDKPFLPQERRQLSFFGRLISSADSASSMRWCFVFTYIMLNSIVWIVWASLSIANMRMESWSTELGLAYAAGLGVATGGKLLQGKWQSEENTKIAQTETVEATKVAQTETVEETKVKKQESEERIVG